VLFGPERDGPAREPGGPYHFGIRPAKASMAGDALLCYGTIKLISVS
jgi:hypothetical protein